jgi:hypothetical protein
MTTTVFDRLGTQSAGSRPVCRREPTRILKNVGSVLAASVFAVVILPSIGWAHTSKNCPPEPAQGVSIVSGETYYGTNCVLYTTGDVDEFVFNVKAGDTWSMVAGLGASPTTNICLTLLSPGVPANQIFYGCTTGATILGGSFSVGTNQTLTAAGQYTIKVSESTDATVTYGLSLERLSPAPTDGIPAILSQNLTGEVSPPTAQDAFTFDGNSAGEYQITASLAPSQTSNVCFNVYQPNGSIALSGGCTTGATILGGSFSITGYLTPAQDGTYVIVVYAGGNDSTVDYNLEVSCFAGKCTPTKTKCILDDTLSYSSGTLTMDFTVGTPYAATWNAWLVSGNTTELLWSQSQPITEPPASQTKTQAVPVSGTVGILSTLSTSTGGITCSSWETVSTGTP